MDLMFLILLLPFFIYWCVNEKTGLQLCIACLLCIWALLVYRDLQQGGRLPFNFDIRWIIIALIFCGCLFLRGKIEKLLSKGGLRAFMIAAAALSFAMILHRPGFEYMLPGGILLGFSIGYCLNKRYIGFSSADVLQRKGFAKFLVLSARFLLGAAVLALIVYRVEKVIEQASKSQNIFLYCFLCYALISLWVSAAAPWVFIKLRLAGSPAIAEKQ